MVAKHRLLFWLSACALLVACGDEKRLDSAEYVASVEKVCAGWLTDRNALDDAVSQLESRTQEDLGEFGRKAAERTAVAKKEMLALRGPGDLEASVATLWKRAEENQAELVKLMTSPAAQEDGAAEKRDALQSAVQKVFDEFIADGFAGCRELDN